MKLAICWVMVAKWNAWRIK